jgi:hypothetical protein
MTSFTDTMKAVKSVSPMRIAASISNIIVNQVRVRTVLIFLGFDLLISIGIFVIYLIFRDLALVGIITTKWKAYAVLASLRAKLITFGMFAIFKHRLRFAQIFFGIFLFNILLFIFLAIPVLRLSCRCDSNWYQCSAMQVFAADGRNVYYIPPPEGATSESHPGADPRRRMVIKQMPSSSDRVPPVSLLQHHIQDHVHFSSMMNRLPKRSMARLGILDAKSLAYEQPIAKQDFIVSNMINTSPSSDLERRLQKALSQRMGGNRTVGILPNAAELSMLLDVPTNNSHYARLSCLEWLKKKQEALTQEEMTMNEATFTDNEVLSSTFCDVLSDEMRKELKEEVKTWLQRILGSSEAPVTETTTIPEENWDEDYEIATNIHVPTLTSAPTVEPLVTESEAVSVSSPNARLKTVKKKDPSALAVETSPTVSLPPTVKEEQPRSDSDFDDAARDRYLAELNKEYSQTCRCEDESCLYHENADGSPRFWCYIHEASYASCLANNIEVKLDKSNNKPWTTGICEGHECKCSNKGEPPKHNDPKVIKTMLENKNHVENQMLYGKECNKWTTDDTFQWCWVGWDTRCIDRLRPSTPEFYNGLDLKRQFKSYMACPNNDLERRLSLLKGRCDNWKYTMDVFFGLHLVLSCVMSLILFKLISNRLGDTFKVEEHFAVLDSDDEDEIDAGDEAAGTQRTDQEEKEATQED